MHIQHSVYALFLMCCLTLTPAVGLTAEANDAAKKTAPAAPAKKRAVQAPARSAADPQKLQMDLDAFARNSINRMNSLLKPGINSKQITKISEGYQAIYSAVDPASLSSSYSRSEHKAVPYIGRLTYQEVDYVCIGKTEKEARSGPFNEINRRTMMELIKYMNGKWTY